MRFRILGPLEVELADGTIRTGRSRNERVLAALLLDANRLVTIERLIDFCWDSAPPRTARKLVQNAVSVLRDHVDVVARPSGYLVRVAEDELDLTLFTQATTRAKQARPVDAAAELRAALGLWRGPTLMGMPGQAFEACAAALEDTRLSALEECLAHEIELGRHHEVVGELSALVTAHPLRERLVGLLMLALHRCGRRADALAAFRQARAVLADELGIDPGDELSKLHEAVLRGEAKPAEPKHTPAQLPGDVAEFTGRAEYLDELDSLANNKVVALAGPGGVGKTALAVHWAHRVRGRFADGQLYVNLRGYAPTAPMSADAALGGFLRALGVPANQVPADRDEAAALYRSLLADKHMLVVLDNARDVGQVRPLLPGGPGCLVLVTSRDRLGGLIARDGARLLAVEVLREPEAVALLTQIVTETADMSELARLCAYLPLALRIAAANLVCHPQLTVAAHVAQLSGANRLGELVVEGDEDGAVRATFDLSYAAQPEDVRRMFRLLGLVPGPSFTAATAAALADVTEDAAQSLLSTLVSAYLVEDHAGRYAFHDLLRLYAGERVQLEESPEERTAAMTRLLDFYLVASTAAADQLNPNRLRLPLPAVNCPAPKFDDRAHALSWLDQEWPNLKAAVAHTAAHGPHAHAWLLADRVYHYCTLQMPGQDWVEVAGDALAAAQAEGDLTAQTSARYGLGLAHEFQSRYELALEHLTQGLELARSGGWSDCEPMITGQLGASYRRLGMHEDAARQFGAAVDLARRTGRHVDEAANLGNLANLYTDMGELEKAADHGARSVAIYQEHHPGIGEAISRVNLGEILRALGRLDEAFEHLDAGLRGLSEHGPRYEAGARRMMAGWYCDAGRHEEALREAERAVVLGREIGFHRIEASASGVVGTVHQERGEHRLALEHHERAWRMASENQDRFPELSSLIGMALAHCALGDPERALPLAEEAAKSADVLGYRVIVGNAHVALATINLALGDHERGLDHAEMAVAVHRATGHRLGEERAQRLVSSSRRGAACPSRR
ncbi:BTAD domain-containing putative transcriptional regulator [Lentzea sp. NPDC051838]|uniref:AfsR/SARP family transcriptional regulator n=1 Tax=Lentzea sp. NPDC051838 TaxID=3154849 RepID=UPI003443774A